MKMGKVKQLRQDEIDKALEEYHDEIKLWEERYGENYSPEDRKELNLRAEAKAKKRLVSKLHASGCDAREIEILFLENI